MTTEHIWFLIGVFTMSAGVSYAWWMKIRVVWLRQDIYDYRDELFMEALRRGCVQDPAGQAAREHLNCIARVSPVLSLFVLAHVVQFGLAEKKKFPRSKDKGFDEVVGATMKKAGLRVQHYLLRQTLTGLLLVPLARAALMDWLVDRVISWVELWGKSMAPEAVFQLLKRSATPDPQLPVSASTTL